MSHAACREGFRDFFQIILFRVNNDFDRMTVVGIQNTPTVGWPTRYEHLDIIPDSELHIEDWYLMYEGDLTFPTGLGHDSIFWTNLSGETVTLTGFAILYAIGGGSSPTLVGLNVFDTGIPVAPDDGLTTAPQVTVQICCD